MCFAFLQGGGALDGRFRWDDLRIFLAVAREGQLSAAGRALGLDAATVGRRVSALEAAYGARLFDRSPRGYSVTDAGRRLIAPATAMEQAALTARPEAPLAGLSGTVRIGAPEGVATHILSSALVDLADRFPSLSLELAALPRLFSLSQREADLAVTVTPPQAGRLTVRKIADYHLHLYATPDVAARIRTPEDLKKERMMGYVSDLIFDRALDYIPLIDAQLRPQLSSTSIHVQQRWTAEGAGVCVLHDFAAADDPHLVKVLPGVFSFTRAFYLVRHADDLGLARFDRVADALVAAVRTQLTRK
jgi:DNA-binding transcriptional LysR family regulator